MPETHKLQAQLPGRRTRQIVLVICCTLLALALAAQAISSILTRRGPQEAVAVFGFNGLAYEQLAFRRFQREATDAQALMNAALAARPYALSAVATDPLAPKAHAISALSIENSSRQAELLSLASRLNRRDLALQGVVLEEALEDADYDRTVATLDQILRVHPDHRQRFYPALLQALAVPEGGAALADLLDGSSPWHQSFLMTASRTSEVQLVLASIRDKITVPNREIDRRLIKGLIRQGALSEARRVYEIARVGTRNDRGGRLTWNAAFPPFDWRLQAQNDFRAQPSRDGERLEIYVRPGQGGVIAQRIIAAPQAPFPVEVTVDAAQDIRPSNIRLQLRCADGGDDFFEEPLRRGRNGILVPAVPQDCAGISLQIYARAMSGEPALRAELGRLVLKTASRVDPVQ